MQVFFIRTALIIAFSAGVTAASAAVYPTQQQLAAPIVQAFNTNPDSILTDFPAGGAGLISRVRDLAASDPTTLTPIINLMKQQDQKLKDINAKAATASGAEQADLTAQAAILTNQIRNIATGLAQVARLAARADQAYYTEIQTVAATSGDIGYAAYLIAIGDAPILSTGGGAGGAGGGGSGGGGPTSTSGFASGGSGGTAQTFGALHYSTVTTSPGTGSVGATTNASSCVSCR